MLFGCLVCWHALWLFGLLVDMLFGLVWFVDIDWRGVGANLTPKPALSTLKLFLDAEHHSIKLLHTTFLRLNIEWFTYQFKFHYGYIAGIHV